MLDYNICLNIDKNDAICFRFRALSKLVLGDNRGAILDCTESIKLDPLFATSYYIRGKARIRIKEKESGCLYLSKAGELGYVDAYDEIKKQCN